MSARGASVPGASRRRSKPEDAGRVLTPVLRELGLDEGLRFENLRRRWAEIFPAPLSLHLAPASLRGGELLLHADSPAWVQEMGYRKAELVSRLSEFGVREVSLRLGRVRPEGKRKKESIPAPRRLSAEEESFVEEVCGKIQDAETREAAKRAVRKSLISPKKTS